ncbi:MAG TPA: sigma-70 family RNA polymerase sigma factor [Candidatus Saccharimonadales bacterium]|nr:sigma-70 family RNA polymerase sigma factor [Candidatus Saccharimonadales bacterium]
MTGANDILFRYVQDRSEDAFAQLVERFLPMVYSAALRQVNGDAALASDVTQLVFTDLARNAPTLPLNVVLSGWLYRHTCFTASKAVRGERRRKAREDEAMLMQKLNEGSEPPWKHIEPLLDEGLQALGASDRNAIVLRFFDGRDLQGVGDAMGTTQDAAQKRISRALEKLRRFFSKKGLACSTVGLASGLTSQSLLVVPPGLGSIVVSTAMAAGTTATSSFSFFTFGKFILMQKLKATALTTLVLIGVGTPLVLQQQSVHRLRRENAALRDLQTNSKLESPATAANSLSASEEERLSREHAELLRLRAETSRLRTQLQELARLQEANKKLLGNSSATNAAGLNFVPSETWADVGFASPLDSLQTAHWAIRHGNIEKFKESVIVTEAAKKFLNSLLAGAPPEAAAEAKKLGYGVEEGLLFPMMAQDRKQGYKGYKVTAQESASPDDLLLRIELQMNSGVAQKQAMRFQRFGSDWKHVIDIVDLNPPEETQAAQ